MPSEKENYSYVINTGDLNVFKTNKDIIYKYGDVQAIDLPLTSSIDIKYLSGGGNRKYIQALKNALDSNYCKSKHFLCSSSLGDKLTQDLTLISIPSIFFGSSIEKGSIEIENVYSGTLVCKLQDSKKNGELIETVGINTGSVAGVVLYDYGFIILTGSWNQNINQNSSEIGTEWYKFGNDSEYMNLSGTHNLKFNGTTYIQTLTMLAHAEKSKFNHSNNPTYIEYQKNINPSTSSNYYLEPKDINIKNITKYAYDNFEGDLEKQVYISKIGIFDEKKKLIGIAKLAKPVRKSETRDFTFKLKLDI